MKILVTGANGYLGSGIVRKLLDDGHDVIAVDFKTDRVDRRAHSMECDLFAIENPYDYFCKPEIVLHLAWRDGFVHFSNTHIDDLAKHCKFLQSMINSGIKRVAVMGSMHEVGFYEGSIDETTPCHPRSLYGIAKNALRDTTELYAEQAGVEFQWLRGYYIVGNSAYGSSVFCKIVKAVSEGKKEFPFTMGLNQFDFLDYGRFCNMVAAAVEQDTVKGIIEICSGRPEKLSDRIERFIKDNKYNIILQYGKFPDRPYDSKAVWGNSRKIERILENTECGQ